MTKRRMKLEQEKPQTKEKFLVDAREASEQPIVSKFTAANQKQKTCLAMFKEGKTVLFLVGSAGTGKSLLAAYQGATLLKGKQIDKIYLVRPAVSVGKSVGLLPGTLEEKLAPYFAQTIAHLEYFMGKGYTKYCLEKEVIEMKAVEYLRGTSFEDCYVIFEESQNFTIEEFEMLLTRLGRNATFVFTGDTRQHDLKGYSGLATILSKLQTTQEKEPDYLTDEDLDLMEDGIGVVEFLPEDVVRSGLTKAFVKMFYNQ